MQVKLNVGVVLLLLFSIISFFSFAQPSNNNYASAVDISSLIVPNTTTCSANAIYTTVGATADQAKGSCWQNGPNKNVWFKFTATSTSAITVQVNVGGVYGTLQNPFVAIWTSGLSQVACQNYVSGGGSIQTSAYGLTNGATYYISVDGYSGYSGTFHFA